MKQQLSWLWIWLSFGVIATILYWDTAHAGYVTDYVGWLKRVQDQGWRGALYTYDLRSHLQGYAASMWWIVKLRGVSDYLVFGITIGWYSAAATGLTQFTSRLLHKESVRQASLFGWCAGLLWIISPTNTEVVVWSVCIHYLVTAVGWMYALRKTLDYFESGRSTHLVHVLVVHAITLIFLELAYSLPLALLCFGVFYRLRYTSVRWQSAFSPAVCTAGLVAVHVLATKLTYGQWIGHYGAEAAMQLPYQEWLANPWRYIGRSLAFTRFWPYMDHVALDKMLARWWSLTPLYGGAALAVAALLLHYLRRRIPSRAPGWLLLLYLGLAGCGVTAVSQLYYYDLLLIDNDRLGTLAGLFVAGGVAVGASMLPRSSGLLVVALYATCSVWVLQTPLAAWRLSHRVEQGLTSSYRQHLLNHQGPVYLIGYANTAQGAPILRDTSAQVAALESTVAVLDNRPLRHPLISDFAQFNQGALTDHVNAEWGNERLYVSLAGTGSWWWRKGRGLTSFSDSLKGYQLSVHEWHFEVTWQMPPPANTLFLYQQGDSLVRLSYPVPGSPTPDE